MSDLYALIVTDLSSLQIQVRARDSGIPVKEAQVFATVYVARNPSLPEFKPDVYRATIKEDRTPGTSILRVTATDADGVSFSSIFFSFLFFYFFVCVECLFVEKKRGRSFTSF